MIDPRPQLMSIITACRMNDFELALDITSEMTEEELQMALAFMIRSHIAIVEMVAEHNGDSADDYYRQMALEQTKGFES